MKARRVLLTAGLAAVLGLGLGVAHASSLTVSAASLTTRSLGACSTTQIAVSEAPTNLINIVLGYTAVTLTVPASCAGTDLAVTVHTTSGGAVQATAGASDVPAGPITLATSATYGGWFRPAYAVALTMDGWAVPATF